MNKTTIRDLLKENNKEEYTEEFTNRGYNKIDDLLKLNKDGKLLDFLKEITNDDKDAHFLSIVIQKNISKNFMKYFWILMGMLVALPLIMYIFISLLG